MTLYRFAGFQLDAAARTLRRGEASVALPAKAFDCLLYLIEHRDRAVGRDELMAAVWGKADVTDAVLGQTILMVRRALGDTGKPHRIIRTVVRFGYHWQAAVECSGTVQATASPVAETAIPRNAPTPSAAAVRKRLRVARNAGSLAALACIALAAVLWWSTRAPRPAAPTPVAATPADAALVLPVIVGGSAAPAWIRLGVMDLVAARLHAAGQAVVPSDNVVALVHSHEYTEDDPARLQALADTAAARLVIGANAESMGDHWRVSLRTLRGRTPALAVSAEGPDVLGAARAATDRLAVALGLSIPRATDPSGLLSADPLVQQIEAALLEDRVDIAQGLLDGATPEQRRDPSVRFQRGRVDFQSGHLDAAGATFEALAASVPAETDPAMHGQILNALGGIALQRRQADAAVPLFDAAIATLAKANAVGALGKAYGNRATAHAMRGDYPAELADLAQARIALTAAGDQLGLAVIDSNAAATAMNRDRFAEAAPVLTDAIQRLASFHAYAAELNALRNLAEVQLALLDPAAAADTARRLAELVPLVPDPERRNAARLIRAEALQRNGRLAEADILLQQLRTQAAADPAVLAATRALAARDALAAGDAAAAAREAAQALPNLTGSREHADAWLTLIRAQLALGDRRAADATMARSRAWTDSDGSAAARVRLALAQAERAAAEQDPGSRAAFEAALAQAGRGRVPADLLLVSNAYVAWLMRQQDFKRASEVAEGVSAWAAHDYCAALLRLRVFHALHDPAAWQAALAQARALAGERTLPTALAQRVDTSGNLP